MDEKNLIKNAVDRKNDDEHERLKRKRDSLDSLFNSPNLKSSELLYEEQNRIAKEIDEARRKK